MKILRHYGTLVNSILNTDAVRNAHIFVMISSQYLVFLSKKGIKRAIEQFTFYLKILLTFNLEHSGTHNSREELLSKAQIIIFKFDISTFN